jgi:hypothetical protein
MRSLRYFVVAAAVVLGSVSLGTPSQAQSIEVGPGGLRVSPYDRGYDRGYDWDRGRGAISRWDAIRAARNVGLIDVDEASRRGPHWVIEGSDRRGRDMRVTVHGWNGRVIDIDRY